MLVFASTYGSRNNSINTRTLASRNRIRLPFALVALLLSLPAFSLEIETPAVGLTEVGLPYAVSGAEVWRYDSVRDFQTVNGAAGRGGAIDQAGAVAVDGMLYFLSGYAKFSGNPGNVLLAFELK